MSEVTAVIDGDELVIRVPMHKQPIKSKSGKSLIVASSGGNQVTKLEVSGKLVIVGCNAYIKA